MALGRTRRAWLIVTLLLASMAGVLWLAGRAQTLQWLAEYVVSKSDGTLALQGVKGSLYGPIQVSGLVFETSERRVELSDLELDWSPRDIVFHKQVRVQTLRAQTLTLTIKQPSVEPLQLPDTLQLPLGLEVPAATVERIIVEAADQHHEFSLLKLAVKNPGDQYHIAASINTPWGTGGADISMGATSPYSLSGEARLDKVEQPHAYTIVTSLAGRLEEVTMDATAHYGPSQAQANAVLALFHAVPLKQATLRAQRINPQQFDTSLPHADLNVDISLQPEAPHMLRGVVKVANTMPGSIDAARIPLKQLQAEFEGSSDQLVLRTIQLDLGAAGLFTGSGGLRQGQFNFDLSTAGLNLNAVHGTLKPTQLVGKVHLGVEGDTQIMQAEFEQAQYRIQLDAMHRDAAIKVTAAKISSYDSALELQGVLQLTPQREFQVAGMLKKFDPARFGDYPAASINGRFSADGKLSPALQAAVQVAIADSHYRNRPLSGKGSATVSLQRLRDVDLELRLGADRLVAQGGFGASDDALSWRLSAADIGAWMGPRFGGRITASGTLTGSVKQPAGVVEVSAENLRWEDAHKLARMTAHGQLEQGLDGPLRLQVELQGYRATELEVEQVLINAQGRRSDHEILFSARNKIMDMRATLKGGWHEQSGWIGAITSLKNSGRYPVALMAEAKLALSQRSFSLTGASLTAAGGEIHIATLAGSDGRMSSQGVLEGVRVAELLKLAQQPLHMQTTLVLGGKWTLQATDKVNGEVSLWRDEGDVTVLTEPRTVMGLTRMGLRALIKDNQIATTAELAGTALGVVTARIHSSLVRRDEVWGISGDAALAMNADVNMPSIAWLAPLLGNQVEIDGAVKVRMSAQGTVNNPNLVGELRIDGFRFDYPQHGISFTQGSLQASVGSDNLLVGRFELQGGAGSVSGDASLGWVAGEPELKVALTANKLKLLSRPDRLLILSGKSEAIVHAGAASVTAKLKADQGLIELPEVDAPSLSEDVVVLGRPAEAVSSKTRYALMGDLDIDLGDEFHLKGKGVDARLVGAVKVLLNGQTGPTASGNIRVAKGSYYAYGQSLSIERGILNFSGPIDNPGLNIIALRKNLPVEAGVAISGTALSPQVRLTSTPSVPDSEKLSWLVLGHGLEKTSGGEFSALQAAAGALLAQGESVSLEAKIAHAAGLDEFSLAGAGGVENTVLTLGKRLSSRAYLTFEQGLAGASNLAKINYSLTDRLSVRTQAGTEGAVDLFYTFRFD